MCKNLSLKLFYSQISNRDLIVITEAHFRYRNDKIVKPHPFDLGAGKWIETTWLTG